MRRLALLAAIMLAGALATPAHAGWRTDRATAIARIVWKHPCVDRMQIEWLALGGAAAEADASFCFIYLDSTRSLSWEQLCHEILHESGHLAGKPHSTNPRSVMYPAVTIGEATSIIHGKALTRWVGADSRCRNRGRPFLRLHSVL